MLLFTLLHLTSFQELVNLQLEPVLLAIQRRYSVSASGYYQQQQQQSAVPYYAAGLSDLLKAVAVNSAASLAPSSPSVAAKPPAMLPKDVLKEFNDALPSGDVARYV